ncbi:MAG: hypothetical protein PHX09_03410 [Clostridia bacterium]|nr:hypothetical protein [Clostridia bacterium]MDD4697501.1 hypothetical protein [Fermentimonas sp.]
MTKIYHQFLNQIPDWQINYLFLGTFNPESGEKVNYFYGRHRNQTWKILSNIFNVNFDLNDKVLFLNQLKNYKIACLDVINSVDIPNDQISHIIKDSAIINNFVKREYNTDNILNIISKNNCKVFSTWGKGSNNKDWLDEISKIPNIIPLVSPSMAAYVPKGTIKFDYMLSDWSNKIKLM